MSLVVVCCVGRILQHTCTTPSDPKWHTRRCQHVTSCRSTWRVHVAALPTCCRRFARCRAKELPVSHVSPPATPAPSSSGVLSMPFSSKMDASPISELRRSHAMSGVAAHFARLCREHVHLTPAPKHTLQRWMLAQLSLDLSAGSDGGSGRSADTVRFALSVLFSITTLTAAQCVHPRGPARCRTVQALRDCRHVVAGGSCRPAVLSRCCSRCARRHARC